MTADIELLPMPPLHIAPSVEPVDYPNVAQALMDYARANVAHATAEKDAEIKALRAEAIEWRGLFGMAKARADKAEDRAERLAEALRDIESRPWNGVRPIQIAARAALRDHDGGAE